MKKISLFLWGLLIIGYSHSQVLDTQSDNDLKKVAEEAPNLSEIFSISKIIWSIIFLIAGYFIIRILTKVLELIAERSTTYRITLKGFVPVVRILSWVLLLTIIIAGIFRPPAATILALSASIGVAVGFAAQDILKNIFGGIVILFDRPFVVGDKIEVGDYYGEVVNIGLRSTRVVTPGDSLVSIPNSEIMNGSVSNTNSGSAYCQVIAEILLPMHIDTLKARSLAIQAAQVSKLVYLKKPIKVLFFNEVKDRKSYLKMKLSAYVTDIREEFTFKSEMTELVVAAFFEHGLISKADFE
ncbi:mechanosensitive ion channel family protein [Ekhidna sp.]|uniref:mechanosensitive ion channel family protein n=1 Tax=Ekhidna sp. TaxID=2608089 RepID=UPI003B5152D7